MMENFFEGKDILVTGGCGSIGSEIVKHLLKYNVSRIRIFDQNESGQFHILQNFSENKKLRSLLGDVRDKERIRRAMQGVDMVFHAAALKHVPMCEYNPYEAAATNVMGTKNIIDSAMEENVERMIAISTDKAVNPVNTMGATKLLSEKLVLNAPTGITKTLFSCVRFGNVLNSDGSVIPIFKQQIEKGGPVTVTSDSMIRFFMTIDEAVNMILKSAQIMEGREIFILKMNALRIIDLAEVMIEELAPKKGLDTNDIEIKIVGMRPGERLYEYLMTEEEAEKVEEKSGMFVIKPELISPHFVEIGTVSKPLDKKYYDARKAELLKKDQIRKLLYNSKII
jgi:FlaA1/EpsC-like NDP-sugar epimerase